MADRRAAAVAAALLVLLVAGAVSLAAPLPAVRQAADTPAGSSPAGAASPVGVQPGRMQTARAALDEVLAQREFQRSAAAVWAEGLRQRLARWMTDIMERWGARPGGRGTAARVLAWIVGIGALIALAVWLVRSLVTAAQPGGTGFAPPASRRRSARSWARDALAAHRDGAEREAARCAYHAALAQLEEYGAWRRDDSRTPREYLRLLPHAHRYRSVLADITSRFERVWYGSAQPSPDDSRAVLSRLKELGCLPSDQAI